jgi:putative DNA primase/helicase
LIPKATVVDGLQRVLEKHYAEASRQERQDILASAILQPLDAKGRKRNGDGATLASVDDSEQLELEFPEDVGPPPFSDDELAFRFADEHEGALCYVALWGKWQIYDGRRWRSDETLHTSEMVRLTCRVAAAEARENSNVSSSSASAKIASAKTVMAVERLARGDRRLAATVDQWDSDPWLLNTPDGVVDLHIGAVRQHHPDDFITRITAVGPGGECPSWLRFLERITGGDGELQLLLQRVLGYALTGLTDEHALFFLYGTGANGKSVLETRRSRPTRQPIATGIRRS